MSYETLKKYNDSYVLPSIEGLFKGFGVGVSVMFVGKAWTVLFCPQKKVHHLLGTAGSAAFKRQAAVAWAVYNLSTAILLKLKGYCITSSGKTLRQVACLSLSACIASVCTPNHMTKPLVAAAIAYVFLRMAFSDNDSLYKSFNKR